MRLFRVACNCAILKTLFSNYVHFLFFIFKSTLKHFIFLYHINNILTFFVFFFFFFNINRFFITTIIKKTKFPSKKKTFNLPNTSLTLVHVESTESRSKSN
jgi:hypothetical protein